MHHIINAEAANFGQATTDPNPPACLAAALWSDKCPKLSRDSGA
jgi:hypothetical protein